MGSCVSCAARKHHRIAVVNTSPQPSPPTGTDRPLFSRHNSNSSNSFSKGRVQPISTIAFSPSPPHVALLLPREEEEATEAAEDLRQEWGQQPSLPQRGTNRPDPHTQPPAFAFDFASNDDNNNNNFDDNADIFLQTALSLGLEGDDLLFNMMFFEEDMKHNFGAMLDTMQQETLALHSDHNTPYKLHPASERMKATMVEEVFHTSTHGLLETECQVCKEDLCEGERLLHFPTCKHFFHKDCLLRWVELVSVCLSVCLSVVRLLC
jgi:hypothetical protein